MKMNFLFLKQTSLGLRQHLPRLGVIGLSVLLLACSPQEQTNSAAAPTGFLDGLKKLLGSDSKNAPAQGQKPPAPEVGVMVVSPATLNVQTELPGRIEASRTAQIRARVAGVVQKRLFTEGSLVKAGQVLFQIDPAPFQAALSSAQAQVLRANANITQTTALVDRYQPLVKANAISQQEFVNAQSAQAQAKAELAIALAAVQTAQINLDYTQVKSPISGRIGRALVTEGALVGQGEVTQMALVQQIDPVYVNFTQSSSEVMKLRQAMNDGKLQRVSGSDAAQIHLILEDGSAYAKSGKLLFSDLSVDASTGQIALRAEVPNHNDQLLPGSFVHVRIEQAQMKNVMAVPQQAVTRGSQGDSVMVVDEQGKVTPRMVKIALGQNNQWIVLSGLKEGEQVMIDGFQKLRGAPVVKAVPFQKTNEKPNQKVEQTPDVPQGESPKNTENKSSK